MLELPESLWLELCNNGHFMQREQAEQDPRYRQVIPYCLVRFEGQFLLMRRTKRGGEARLHNLYTLGVGGHINPQDLENGGEQGFVIFNAMRRELLEEIFITDYQAKPVGLIVMNDSAVSDVHAGVVFVIDAGQSPSVRETEKLEGRLASKDEVQAVYEQLESWSQLVWDWMGKNKTGD